MSRGNSFMDSYGSRTSYNDSPAGMEFWGVLTEGHQELLRFAYEDSLSRLAGEWRQSLAHKQVSGWMRFRGNWPIRFPCR